MSPESRAASFVAYHIVCCHQPPRYETELKSRRAATICHSANFIAYSAAGIPIFMCVKSSLLLRACGSGSRPR